MKFNNKSKQNSLLRFCDNCGHAHDSEVIRSAEMCVLFCLHTTSPEASVFLLILWSEIRSRRDSAGLATATHRKGLSLIPGQSMWDLWWEKWNWDRFFSEHIWFPLSLLFHQSSLLICVCHRRYINLENDSVVEWRNSCSETGNKEVFKQRFTKRCTYCKSMESTCVCVFFACTIWIQRYFCQLDEIRFRLVQCDFIIADHHHL
jgi:hypothetical protein